MTKFVPEFHGATVKRITMERGGLTLWVVSPANGLERKYLLADAEALLGNTREGILRNELTDAIRICRSANRSA